jgi:fructose/tagatose bisphosphate aldolase
MMVTVVSNYCQLSQTQLCQTFAEKPAEFDPRKYLGPARDNMEKLYKHKIINVLGSNDKL